MSAELLRFGTPSETGSWGGGEEEPGYYKSAGRVYLTGKLHNGADGSHEGTIFPAGQGFAENHRPTYPRDFLVLVFQEGTPWTGSHYEAARLTIHPDGSMAYAFLAPESAMTGNGASYISFEGVSFLAGS